MQRVAALCGGRQCAFDCRGYAAPAERKITVDKFIIKGGKRLHGEVVISGAKNAAVAIIPAVAMAEPPCRIENVPNISDVKLSARILTEMGATVRWLGKIAWRSTRPPSTNVVPSELGRKMRGSYYNIGALLGRCSQGHCAASGGCDFGVRPIDQHQRALRRWAARTASTMA